VVLRVPTSVLRIPHAIVGDRCPGIAAFERYLYDEHWRPRYCLFTAAGLNDPLLHAEHEDLGDPEAAAALESSELSRVAARLETALDYGYGVVRWIRRQCARATHALGACCGRNRRRASREGVGSFFCRCIRINDPVLRERNMDTVVDPRASSPMANQHAPLLVKERISVVREALWGKVVHLPWTRYPDRDEARMADPRFTWRPVVVEDRTPALLVRFLAY